MSRRESASKHSTLVGGSTAGRLLQCPGSFQANLALPPSADVSSIYAEEGTFAHAVMAELMRDQQESSSNTRAKHDVKSTKRLRASSPASHEMKPTASLPGSSFPSDLYALAASWIGRTFHDRALTQEHVDTLIAPALDMLEQLQEAYGGGFEVAMIEAAVEFPRLASAYGTADLILINTSHVLLIDYKFGAGVPVKAVYADPEGEFVNSQLMFYLAAAVHTHRRLFAKPRQPVVAIVQPRIENGLDHVAVTRKEIRYFIEDVHAAVASALDRNPPLHRGEHCRWCPAKISCPQWTGPLLDLTALRPAAPPAVASSKPTDYGRYLAVAKTLLDQAAMLKQEIDEQMHAYLESGGMVPGWRLKPKVKQRQWIDEKVVARSLRTLGFTNAEIFQTKLQTFASVDATARRRNVVVPDMLRVAPPTSETTIATTDDPAPVVDRMAAIEQFSTALKQLRDSQERSAKS